MQTYESLKHTTGDCKYHVVPGPRLSLSQTGHPPPTAMTIEIPLVTSPNRPIVSGNDGSEPTLSFAPDFVRLILFGGNAMATL